MGEQEKPKIKEERAESHSIWTGKCTETLECLKEDIIEEQKQTIDEQQQTIEELGTRITELEEKITEQVLEIDYDWHFVNKKHEKIIKCDEEPCLVAGTKYDLCIKSRRKPEIKFDQPPFFSVSEFERRTGHWWVSVITPLPVFNITQYTRRNILNLYFGNIGPYPRSIVIRKERWSWALIIISSILGVSSLLSFNADIPVLMEIQKNIMSIILAFLSGGSAGAGVVKWR